MDWIVSGIINSYKIKGVVMKSFKDWFKKKPQPTDLLLALEYEHEEPMLPPNVADRTISNEDPQEAKPLPKKSRKKKDKVLEPVPIMILPTNVPEPKSYEITLRNLSVNNTAVNITVLPVRVKIPQLVRKDQVIRRGIEYEYDKEWTQEEVSFSPKDISSLGPGKSIQLSVEYKPGGPIERFMLHKVLHKSSDPTTINELFDDYTFTVEIYFESIDERAFSVIQEIIFRPWKNKISMGRIERTELF
jgi:hypothetical protein